MILEQLSRVTRSVVMLAGFVWLPAWLSARESKSIVMGEDQANISVESEAEFRTYELTTTADLRDGKPRDKRITVSESPEHASIRTGNLMFDGLYAMAVAEARANSVSQIKNEAFANNEAIQIQAFQTGEFWTYVWTRDLSYSAHLALAGFDPQRAAHSLLFKSSTLKSSVRRGLGSQIIQDTGSGGSYPVSTDRAVWALGVYETLKYLPPKERKEFLEQVYPILCNTIEQDRKLIFDPADELYRGEQSFLDWREQTYPGWTKDNVLAIALSKALSTNAAHYFLLRTAGEYSGLLNKPDLRLRYAKWAELLKTSINARFFDAKAGLYRAYLLSDEAGHVTPVNRYDLLGESLAILFRIADQERAELVIKNYPTGVFGPPVVWPQERTVPIYHNQAIWPFVTAYWIKAAQHANNPAAVDAGIDSLQRLAAMNLSNMENFDFISGRSHGERGPVVNSRRQLWSVAGYLSMVQDVVFGLQTSWEGIRFRPFITARQRNETFASNETVELRGLTYQGTKNTVRVHLPPANFVKNGVCLVNQIELNGRKISGEFVEQKDLQVSNTWDVFIKAPTESQNVSPLHLVDVSKEDLLFAPAQPRWKGVGVTLEGNHPVLSFEHDNVTKVSFNIYRDGQLCAKGIRDSTWKDDESGDLASDVHTYAVEAIDLKSGISSHLISGRCYRTTAQRLILPAKAMRNLGGNMVATHHFENWGKPEHELATSSFQVGLTGRYIVRTEFSNGAGPVNTGITCAVKKLEIRKAASPEVIAAGYLIMPQSGDWKRYDPSSPVNANLIAGEDYTIRIFEDEYCRNMSYLKSNERYTAAAGGGEDCYNYVNVAACEILFVSSH